MKVELDIFEMGYLLDACIRGSHLRAGTVQRFVDEWYDKFTDREREELFEWTYRLTYDRDFKISPRMCGADKEFVLRYNPDNQYIAHTLYNGKEESVRCYLDKDFSSEGPVYKTKTNTYISPEYIVSVEKVPFSADHDTLLYDAVTNIDMYAKSKY